MSRGRHPRRSPARFGTMLVVFVLGLLAIDFLLFAQRAANMKPDPAVKGDAIVALTGGSGLRIAEGVKLVSEGRGGHLLISGVHPDVTMEELIELAGGDPDVWACCVTIGHAAETTLGNADETAAWAYENGYHDLIVVTSDYHMARSVLVLQDAMPDLTLEPWPVRTVIDPSHLFTDYRSLKGVFLEWAKWRVTTLE
ncbi:YdcF family protein [Hyphomonas jannaschiana]|uniref:YdcF family protein n=1 Tax=Hyphomonas jannaschiana TaxID=86 RepID=UPI0035C7222E